MHSRQQDESRRSAVQAIGLVCLAGLLFVGMNAAVKGLTTELNPVMLTWARYFFHVLMLLLLFPTRLLQVPHTPQLGIQIGRSFLLLASTAANFAALYYLSLAQVTSITFTSPIMVAALAALLVRERVEAARWFAIALGCAGMLMVVRPFGSEINAGSLLALSCAATYALYQVSTRMVREAVPIVSLFFAGLAGMVTLTILVPFFWIWPSPGQWVLLVGIGIAGGTGHLLVIMALQRAQASRVTPFTYVQLVWAMLASFLLFGDVPDRWTLAGAAVITASGLLVYRLNLADRRDPRRALAGN